MFGLGNEAGRRGGCAPAVYNASNEVAVQAFLENRIRFPEIAAVVGEAMRRVGSSAIRDIDDVMGADAEARAAATETASRLAARATMGTSS